MSEAVSMQSLATAGTVGRIGNPGKGSAAGASFESALETPYRRGGDPKAPARPLEQKLGSRLDEAAEQGLRHPKPTLEEGQPEPASPTPPDEVFLPAEDELTARDIDHEPEQLQDHPAATGVLEQTTEQPPVEAGVPELRLPPAPATPASSSEWMSAARDTDTRQARQGNQDWLPGASFVADQKSDAGGHPPASWTVSVTQATYRTAMRSALLSGGDTTQIEPRAGSGSDVTRAAARRFDHHTLGLTLAGRMGTTVPLHAQGEGSAASGKPGSDAPAGDVVKDVMSLLSRLGTADETGEREPLAGRVKLVGFQATPPPVAAVTASPAAGPAVQVANALGEAPSLASRPETAASQTAGETAPRALRSLDIQLQPVELGRVNARLTLVGGQLAVELRVETAEAHRRLSTDSETIVKSLKAAGYEVERVTVQQLPAATPAAPAGERGGIQHSFEGRGQNSTGENSGRGGSGKSSGDGDRGAGPHEGSDRDSDRGGVYI